MRIHDACLPEQPNTHRNQTTVCSIHKANSLLVLLLLGSLDLCRSAEGLEPVLTLMACSDVSTLIPPGYSLSWILEIVSVDVRCALDGFSILSATPTRTRRKCGSNFLRASGES